MIFAKYTFVPNLVKRNNQRRTLTNCFQCLTFVSKMFPRDSSSASRSFRKFASDSKFKTTLHLAPSLLPSTLHLNNVPESFQSPLRSCPIRFDRNPLLREWKLSLQGKARARERERMESGDKTGGFVWNVTPRILVYTRLFRSTWKVSISVGYSRVSRGRGTVRATRGSTCIVWKWAKLF